MKKIFSIKNLITIFLFAVLITASMFAYASKPRQIDLEGGFLEPERISFQEKNIDIEAIYNKQIPCDVTFENNIDPYEQQDNYSWTLSPYPDVRLVMPMYSLKTIIEPGYYLLTPRQIGARYYILFKQSGKILYSVPVYESKQIDIDKEYQRIKDPYEDAPFGLKSIFKAFGVISGRRTHIPKLPQYKVNCYDYDDRFYGMDIYYKDRVYKTVYKTKLYE